MIILGIDPGLATTGYGLIEEKKKDFKLVDYGCISTSPRLPFDSRLKKIYQDLNKIIKDFEPSVFSIEKIFFCKNAKTALEVGQARGIALLTAAQKNLKIYEFTPLEVKQTITGYGKAEKIQVQKMVKLLLNLKEIPRPDDAADALALAICGARNHYLFNNKYGQKNTKNN